MRIALIGYGKMGKAIETIAFERGHQIVARVDLNSTDTLEGLSRDKVDVAIEFTSPHSAANNLTKLLQLGIPVVCGSTGWLERWKEIVSLLEEKKGALVYASNYSVGVNLFFELNKKLATLMAGHSDYQVSLKEIHHTQKKDAPSGTAVTLAEDILAVRADKHKWVNEASVNPEELSILSERIDPAPGTHHILYRSPIDEIEIIHTAHNRTGFATGAVLAAEFLLNHPTGLFNMKDVLGI